MNSINLTGRLVADPTRRETNRGVVASFRLAVDGRPRVWIDVEAWGHLAGTVATYLRARRHVAVTGRLAYNEYHDRNGNKQSRYVVVGHSVGFLDGPTGAEPCNLPAGPPDSPGMDRPSTPQHEQLHHAS